MPSQARKALNKEPGLWFGQGVIFSSRHVAEVAYHVLFGPEFASANPDALSVIGVPRATSFFNNLLRYADLYLAVRGNSLFWETALNNWDDAFIDISIEIAKEIESAYSVARTNYDGPAVSSELITVIDQWNSLKIHAASLPSSARQLQLVVRTENVQDMVNSLISITLGGAPAPAPPTWPPAYLAPDDIVYLARAGIRARIHGVTPSNPGQPPEIPGVHADPIKMRTFLSWILLAFYTPNSDWALFGMPVAFLHETLRNKWYYLSGGQSKVFGSMDSFFRYTTNAFSARGKSTVAALLTPWLIKRDQVQMLAPRFASGQPDYFSLFRTNPLAAKMGIALILRRIERGGRVGLQAVVFDPSMNYEPCNRLVRPHHTSVFQFREDLVEKLRTWAAGFGAPVLEIWFGGVLRGYEYTDSVTLSSVFLANVVESGLLPGLGAEDEEAWTALGFKRMDF